MNCKNCSFSDHAFHLDISLVCFYNAFADRQA
jgi:hypothetical protein